MKKIIAIVVLVLIILLVVSLNKDKKVDQNTNNESSNTVSTSINTKDLGLKDGVYNIDPLLSKINWTGRKVVLKNWIDTGTISLKEATFEVKDNNVVLNKFVMDMTSISATKTGAGGGQDKLSTHLKSADFFDVEKFPTSTFVVKEFTATSSQNTSLAYIAKGDLTIKDVTNEVSIPVSLDTSNSSSITIKGSVDLDRTLWNVRYGSEKFFKSLGDNVIDDMFNLSFELKLNK